MNIRKVSKDSVIRGIIKKKKGNWGDIIYRKRVKSPM